MLVLERIETVPGEEGGQALLLGCLRAQVRNEAIEHILGQALVGRTDAAGCDEPFQLGAAGCGQRFGLASEQAGDGEAIVAGRKQRGIAGQDLGPGAPLVDGKIVDHRLHGEGQRMLEFALGGGHDGLQTVLCSTVVGGGEEEAHAAAGHAPQHPEAQKSLPNSACTRAMRVSV